MKSKNKVSLFGLTEYLRSKQTFLSIIRIETVTDKCFSQAASLTKDIYICFCSFFGFSGWLLRSSEIFQFFRLTTKYLILQYELLVTLFNMTSDS
jgi:hypothetical protein